MWLIWNEKAEIQATRRARMIADRAFSESIIRSSMYGEFLLSWLLILIVRLHYTFVINKVVQMNYICIELFEKDCEIKHDFCLLNAC